MLTTKLATSYIIEIVIIWHSQCSDNQIWLTFKKAPSLIHVSEWPNKFFANVLVTNFGKIKLISSRTFKTITYPVDLFCNLKKKTDPTYFKSYSSKNSFLNLRLLLIKQIVIANATFTLNLILLLWYTALNKGWYTQNVIYIYFETIRNYVWFYPPPVHDRAVCLFHSHRETGTDCVCALPIGECHPLTQTLTSSSTLSTATTSHHFGTEIP